MLRKTSSATTAVLFLVQTAISTFPAKAQSVAHGQTGQGDDSESARLVDKIAVLEARVRRASFAGLDVFLHDDYLGPSPVLVRVTCYGQQATPSLAVDAATYGANARLLNLTRRPEHGCSSYQVSAVPLQLAQAGGSVLPAGNNEVPTGIGVSVHYSGPVPADAQVKEPAVFVFNPVHGNWTEAKSFTPRTQDPRRVYATLSEQHQRIIGGVIVLPEPLQAEPARNGPSALAKPLEQVNPANGYLAVDRVEPDSKGSHALNLPMLLRPSRGPGPSFSVRYNSQGTPGVLGRGWDLFISSIVVRGPAPVYHPAYETEDYLLDGMDLIALDAQGKDIPPLYKGGPILPRVSDLRFFRLRNNSSGLIVRRYGSSTDSYFWEVWDPNSHVTKLYGGSFKGNGRKPEFDGGNGVVRGTVPFGDGLRRAAIGQWGLTQEYDRQPARNGAIYFYAQGRKGGSDCTAFWGGECSAALRLEAVEYNRAFGHVPNPILGTGVTRVEFFWGDPRDSNRFNSDGRLGFFRAHEYWLRRIDVLYQPDPNNAWLAKASINNVQPPSGWAFFAQHRFVLNDDNDACMNFDRVLKTYEVEPNPLYDGARAVAENDLETEIALATQTFSFDYEGEKFQGEKSHDGTLNADTCRAVWPDPQQIKDLGKWTKVDGNIAFPSGVLEDLGFGLLAGRSLLGTGRTEETGASLFVGFGTAGNTFLKEITVGPKGGVHFSKSEGNSTLIDITGDGIDDIVYRDGDKLVYCAGQRSPHPVNGVHTIEYPSGRCGVIDGISDLSISSTSTRSFAVEGYGPATVFGGVAFNSSNNDSYVYFTDRDGDGLVDLASYGQVFYGQGETQEPGQNVVRFTRHSALIPPIPGKTTDGKLLSRFPLDMRNAIQAIEARLEATSRHLRSLEYSQTMIAWEAPLTGAITLAGELQRGRSMPDTLSPGALGAKFGPKEFEDLYAEVSQYQDYIDRKARCEIWEADERCYAVYSDPLGPHYGPTPAHIEFIKTPPARLQIWLYKRGPRSITPCAAAPLSAATFDLSSLSFAAACRPNGAPAQQMDVDAGDVIYLGYTIHPHLSAWLKPTAKIAYARVTGDAAFNLFKSGDPQKITEALQCRWKDEMAAGGSGDCLLSKQTRYEFDLKTGIIASAPSATVQVPAGNSRAFDGSFEIPAELTRDYQVFFDVLAEPRPEPDPPAPGTTPPPSPPTPPASLLRRLFRQDVSALCTAVTGICTVKVAPACDSSRTQADCDAFFADPNMPYVLATRITVLHKVSGASLPVRNISARLSDLTWRVPPHVKSIFTEKSVPGAAPGIVFTPTGTPNKTMLVYLPVGMGDPDLEYVRVEQGTFANPDTRLDDGDPEPDKIDFADIVKAEPANVALARIRQTLALCSFRTEILDFLRASFSSSGQPFADDYLNYWQGRIDRYNTRCDAAQARFDDKSFTSAPPRHSAPNTLRLPWFLRDLRHAEQITSAETLLERVLANLALGEELLTDGPRLTRRGYRLPVNVNPLDCKAVAAGLPLTAPIVLPEGDCAYRLSVNFSMQEFEEIVSDAVAKNLREVLARFKASAEPAFTVQLTATLNGRPIGFRQLTGESTGNDPCNPSAPNTCMGRYGTREKPPQEPIDDHFYPKRKSNNPNAPHGDVLQRITVNKRAGRAAAFTNSVMLEKFLPVCQRNYPAYDDLAAMEAKQDCALTDAQKYTGPERYEIVFRIGENNEFLGRNRVLEFRANPLDVLELHFRLDAADKTIARQPHTPNDKITGKFSLFDGASPPPVGINPERYLIPRSPSQVLSRSQSRSQGNVELSCPQVPNNPGFGPAVLPPSCRPWTRLGWTEVLLGAQYRTYSDAQRVGSIENRFSVLRRREILRLHPEIAVEADKFMLEPDPQPSLPTVNELRADQHLAFYSRDPNVTKTGGDWSLFAGKAERDGTLRAPLPFVAPPSTDQPSDRSLRYGAHILPPLPPRNSDPLRDARAACGNESNPNPDGCENHLGSRPDDNLGLKHVDYFPLIHRFVGPVTEPAAAKALEDDPKRPETSVCAAEAPRFIAGCWKSADDTIFLESAVSPFAGVPLATYSVSALAGFERPPIAEFRFQFDSYKKLACIDPQSPRYKIPPIDCPGFGPTPAPGSVKLPNRPVAPAESRAIEVFAPVQSSSSRSVSFNAGTAYVNTDYIHTVVDTTRQFRDVNGDGYPDVIADGTVELTSPVGLSRRDWWNYFRATDNPPALSSELTAGGADQSTTSHSTGAGIGLTASTAAVFLATGPKKNDKTGSPDPNVDPGFSFSLERGRDERFIELRDFNGDGLADKVSVVTKDGDDPESGRLKLHLNAGNSLRAAETDLPMNALKGVPFNTSHSTGFGVRLGFSYGAGSFAAGMGLAHRDSGSQAALIDFTGDGRPDVVLPLDDGRLLVFPNLGNGFGPGKIHKLKDWQLSPQAGKEAGTALSEATLLDAGALFTFGFPIPPYFRMVFTPGVKWARNQTRELLQIRDVNGDGVPDVVAVSGSFLPSLSGGAPTLDPSSLTTHVHYNPEAKYHLLTGITNPSGSKWVLQHGLFGNSGPAHGRAVWALTGAALYDGYEPRQQAQPDLAPDGHDVILTTYDYSEGYYDRAERQFYGFAKRISAVYGCDLGKAGTSCLSVLDNPARLDWATLGPAGYRKLQVIAQAFSNQDFLTQGMELSKTVAGANSSADESDNSEPPLQAVSRTQFGYSIDDLQPPADPLPPQCEMLQFDRVADSWNASSFEISGSKLPQTADGSQFTPEKKRVFGSNSICRADVKGCAAQLRQDACEAGFVREQRAFWAQQTGSVRQRFISLETFGGDAPVSEFSTPADPALPRLISAVAFDHDQWGQVLGFDSVGEADSHWNPSSGSSVNAAIKYAPRQALNVYGSGGTVGYPLLGLAQEIQVFPEPWKDPDVAGVPLRVREALYSDNSDKDWTAVNLTDICLFPGGSEFHFIPNMCGEFKKNMRAALADGYSSMQTALRAAYDNTDGLPKGQSSFDALIHHQLVAYDVFGNVTHAISPLSYNKEWIERRFSYENDPFRRTATSTKLTRCVNDIPGAGADTPSLKPDDKPRCTFGLPELPQPVLRKAVTHASTSRVDTHFGSIVETSDVNDNKVLHDLDRWGRLSLLARSWGNAPRENATFQSRLKLAVAKNEKRKVKDNNGNDIDLTPETMLEVKDYHILAVADYKRISDGLLRSNLRRFDASDSYSGLLGKDQTTRETAMFSDGMGRPIQSIREADVCLGIVDELIDSGQNKEPSAGLAARCEGFASGIVTPSTRIDALGRDLQSFESYAIPPKTVRENTRRRFTALISSPATLRFLVNTTYDGAGRPLHVESRLSEPKTAGTVKGTAQYNYRIVSEDGARLARFEALTLSPRCTASAVWSDARGLKRTVFEDQERFYPTNSALPLGSPPTPGAYQRDRDKTRGFCTPIESMVGTWVESAKDTAAGGQPARVSYTYDPLQQLTGVDYPLDGSQRAAIATRLDLLGRTLELQEPNSGCTVYAYDGLNSLIRETGYRYTDLGKPCGPVSKVRNEKTYEYSGGRLVRMSYHSLEEQGGAPDEGDTVRFYYDRSPYAIIFGQVLETLRFVPNDQANQRFVDVAGRKCDNCIGQATVVSDRSGARSFSFNELGLARREVRSLVAPLREVEQGDGRSETYLPEIAFYEAENAYTAFGDPVQEKLSEGAPMTPAKACVNAGVNTCLARFTIGRKYAPDGAVAQLLFNGKPLINAAQDALGRPAVRWTANGVATGYRYDSEDLRLNQMSTMTAAQRDGSFQPVQVNGYQYDGGGNIVAYANNASAVEQYTSGFAFKYDAVNRLTDFAAAVSKREKSLKSEGAYAYDPGHRFKTRSLRIVGTPGQAFQRDWTYGYRTDPTAGPLHAPRSIAFSAGEGKRLTWFDYDDVGRMTRICTTNTVTTNAVTTNTVTTNTVSEPRVCSAEKPDNDQRLGLLSNRAITWDAEGRLIRVRGVRDPAVPLNSELLLEDYVYDAGGNRALKMHLPPRTDDVPEGAREAATVYMTPYYARPYDGRGTVQLSLGTLPAVSLTAPADQSEEPRTTFLYSDLPVGSMTAAVTGFGEATDVDATLIARREYSPYGLELTIDSLAQTGRDGVAPLSVFHGKELDRLTKFSSFGARYYNRDVGIWLKPDPILLSYLAGGPHGGVFGPPNLNVYAYSHHRPTVAADPDGTWVNVAVGAAIGGVLGGGVEIGRQLWTNNGHISSWGRIGAALSGGIVAGAIAGGTFGASLVLEGAAAGISSAAGGATTRFVLGEETTLGDVGRDAIVGLVTFGVIKGGAAIFRSTLPQGFSNLSALRSFSQALNEGLERAGFGGTKAFLQGSAVTGKSFLTGKPFNAASDFDIALAGETIFSRAKELGIALRGAGARTGPLSPAEISKLGLGELQESLSGQASRDVNFMIFESAKGATTRAPSIGLE
jgi:RHS repeat-associated protein